MPATNYILAPVIALVAWSLVMWIWMYVTRLPAMRKAAMTPDSDAVRGSQMEQLPAIVRWKADNYTHLMEQPTIFYALALSLAVMGEGGGANLIFAWIYVGLRVLHSLVQVLINKIEVRFLIFTLSTFALFGLVINGALSFLK